MTIDDRESMVGRDLRARRTIFARTVRTARPRPARPEVAALPIPEEAR